MRRRRRRGRAGSQVVGGCWALGWAHRPVEQLDPLRVRGCWTRWRAFDAGATDRDIARRLAFGRRRVWLVVGRADAVPFAGRGVARGPGADARLSDGVARDLRGFVTLARRCGWGLGGSAEAFGDDGRRVGSRVCGVGLAEDVAHPGVVEVAPGGGDQVQWRHGDRAVREDRQRGRASERRRGAGRGGPLAVGHDAGGGGVVLQCHEGGGVDRHAGLADGVAADHRVVHGPADEARGFGVDGVGHPEVDLRLQEIGDGVEDVVVDAAALDRRADLREVLRCGGEAEAGLAVAADHLHQRLGDDGVRLVDQQADARPGRLVHADLPVELGVDHVDEEVDEDRRAVLAEDVLARVDDQDVVRLDHRPQRQPRWMADELAHGRVRRHERTELVHRRLHAILEAGEVVARERRQLVEQHLGRFRSPGIRWQARPAA